MTKILFVCHGNICRSPMAEFVFRDMAGERVYCESKAVSAEEIGIPVKDTGKILPCGNTAICEF